MKITKVYKPSQSSKVELPLYTGSVSAGFPSPADDFVETKLDLNEHLIRHPSATFFVRASGDSMIGAGIYNKDILIVDRSLDPVNNAVVIAALDGELIVKRFYKKNGHVFLVAENKDYKTMDLTDNETFSIWGVVTYVIHKL